MTDSKGNLPTLPVLHSKRLPSPIKFPFTAYSHAHDLLAIVTSTWEVSVLRIASGHSAFTVKRKDPDVEITALSWKRDDTYLSIGWSDGTYGIYDGGTGKQLYMTALSAQNAKDDAANWKLDLVPFWPNDEDEEGNAAAKASVLGWMSHELHEPRKAGAKGDDVTTEDWYDGLDSDDASGHKVGNISTGITDLPRAITTLDVTKVLPRLSAIPSHGLPLARGGGNNTKFTTQLSTDNVFASQGDTMVNLIQSLLVCQESGIIQVLLDETVHIGSCQVDGMPLKHAANAQSSRHALLTKRDDGVQSLSLLDLPLMTLGGPLLHVIATNTKRMQTLLDYILQTVRCIQHDYETNVSTPARFLNSLQGDLNDRKDGMNCVSTLYHLALTGTFHVALLAWLTDVIKDNNMKRWEQSMNAMYANIQNHLFINLLPALDRFGIAVTSLRGLATFHEGSSKFDCPPHLFSNILDKIDSLRLTAQKMLLVVQTEHRQCRAFLKWLKMQLEIGIADPFSSSALETEEREIPSMDFTLILPYIKESLMLSKLEFHIKDRPGMQNETTKEEFFDHEVIRSMSYERAKKALSEFDALKPDHGVSRKEVTDPVALINLPAITCALVGHVRVVLEQITHWQSRMLPDPITIPLPLDADVEVIDMTMLPPSDRSKTTTIKLLALSPPSDDHRQLSLLSIASPSNSIRTALPDSADAHLLAAKFTPHDPNTLLTLTKDANGDTRLTRHALQDATSPSLSAEVLHTFPSGIAFKPFDMLVGGTKGNVAAVVIGNEGREWRVLDVDGRTRRSTTAEGPEDESAKGKGKEALMMDEDDFDDDHDDEMAEL